MSTMKTNFDLIQWIGHDMSVKVFSCLDDPRDLIRASAVCSSWKDFVIENDLCKKLCLKMIPEVYRVVHSIETDGYNMIEPDSDKLEGYYTRWQCLKRNHKVYAQLAFGLTPLKNNCISKMRKVFANTMERSSSVAESDPSVPDNLVYRLCSKLCLVTEINVRPFNASLNNIHIYSTSAVRFRLGCQRNDEEIDSKTVVSGSQFIWSYTLPLFPMSEEVKMQNFKLPEPVMCIGGILLVELFGRGRKDIVDDVFYACYNCASFVGVVARTISPAFVVMMHRVGRFSLKYYPHQHNEHGCDCWYKVKLD